MDKLSNVGFEELSEKTEKINALAADVLNLSRNTLVINLRFMDKAISMLGYESIPGMKAIAVDGKTIFYDPVIVLKKFSKEKKQLTRQYLHMVLHCVYQHFWINTLLNQEYWNLACDIAVEYTINDLDLEILQTEKSEQQKSEIEKLSKKVKYMTADMLYRHFLTESLSEKEIKKLQKVFSADIHDGWYLPRKCEVDFIGSKNTDSMETIRKEWEDTARQMRMNLESFSKERGDYWRLPGKNMIIQLS